MAGFGHNGLVVFGVDPRLPVRVRRLAAAASAVPEHFVEVITTHHPGLIKMYYDGEGGCNRATERQKELTMTCK